VGAEDNEYTLRRMIDAIVGLLHALVKAVIWAATNPVVLALAAPGLLVVMLLGAVRRRATPEPMPHTAAHAHAGAAATGDELVRRRQSRRRGSWSMLVGQMREAIGFPDADSLREHDFAAPRGRSDRPAPKSA
jgi:hypothetical protein